MAHNTADKFLLQRIALLLSFFYVHPAFSQLQIYPFKQFPLPGSLPPISCMFDDHYGSIWLGTEEGLYRFDGLSFIPRTGQDPYTGLGREAITYLFEDRDLNFWVGAKTGLYRWNQPTKDFDKFSVGDDMFPKYIHQENDTCFLVHCLNEIYWFYPKSGRWEKVDTGIKGAEAHAILRGKHHDLWVGSVGKVRKYDLMTKNVQDFQFPVPASDSPGEKISAVNMYLDSHERLWINTWYKGLVKLDTQTGEAVLIDTQRTDENQHLLDLYVTSFFEAEDGSLWMASAEQGINVYHPDADFFSYIPKGEDCAYGLVGSAFAIMADRDKNIWVKSDRALHYLDRKSVIPVLKSDPDTHIGAALFMRFLKPDYVLVGTYFGLVGINTHSNQVDHLNSLLRLPAVRNAEFQATGDALVREDHSIWVCSPQGLRLMEWKDEASPRFIYKKLFPCRNSFLPSKLFPLGDSLLLVKGRINTGTFATFSLRTGLFDYHTFPDSMSINFAIPYTQDTILLAIRNKGLYYYSLANRTAEFIPWKFKEASIPVQKPVFYKMVALHDGSFALCSENYGLIIYYPEEKVFRHFEVASLTKSNRVYSVQEDHQFNLWIQSPTQLVVYDRTRDSLSKVNLSNSFKGNFPDLFMHEGKALFGIFEGALYEVKLEELLYVSKKPNLSIRSIRARNEQLRNWENLSQIRLSYANSFLSFEFYGRDYNNPQGIQYWYKIPEINEEWQSLGSRTSVYFGRLSPGNYHFMVKARNEGGVWSDEVYAPEIIIRPPFWRTWWFILGALSLIAYIISYFVKLRKTKREAELRLRNQIARDLHDDIGSTLSGIKIFSTVAAGMSGENKDLSSLLVQIRDKSDLMMNSMSDIVWSINPTHDSLHDMMIRLKQYMAEVLESQNIDVHYVTHLDLKSQKIALKDRKDLYLSLKEIINNTAKYAACRNFYMDISRQKDEILMTIKDDGVGMDENKVTYGNGLHNIEARIRQIGGKVIRESSPGHGTKYEIRVNRA